MKPKSFSLAALTFLALVSAEICAQDRATLRDVRTPAPPAATQAKPEAARPASPPDLLIEAGDLLDINMYGVPDFKAEVRVNSGGEASLPMLGSVSLGGLSVEQAERTIDSELIQKRLFNDPHVGVLVKEYAAEGISVLGEVQKPGIYQLMGAKKLYDAISAAGGTTPKAGRYVLITRRNDPKHTLRVPLLTSGPEAMENNVPVEPGDTIVVSKAGLVYVVGDVRQPGGFVLENDKNITVLQAIALAQGMGPNPALNSAKIIRKSSEGLKDVPLPLKKILASKASDIQLQADDIVFIPDSAATGAAKRGMESIVQMATGIAVWRIP